MKRSFLISRETFESLYEALEGNPVTIRFLDPPLHEFVPTEEADIKKLADAQGKICRDNQSNHRRTQRVQPDDGTQRMPSCSYLSGNCKMQTKAVIRAAINVKKAHPDWNMVPEIMIPLVCEVKKS